MIVQRLVQKQIEAGLPTGKAVVVIGPRQVGKTTLVNVLTQDSQKTKLWLTGDNPEARNLLENISLERLRLLIAENEIVVIDEAQRFANIGLTLKLITDQMPGVQLFITGSSSLDLASKTKESLTGRKYEYTLYPFSFGELVAFHGFQTEHALLEERMIYGYYPEIVTGLASQKIKQLYELTDGVMYKDLLMLDFIKKPTLLVKLLQALALQVGNEVSFRELGQLVGADPQTIEKYIDLLEQSFVLFSLQSLSRNARNEIKRGRKIYFYDNGIRNAIIKNFSSIDLRTDKGALWENFMISERKKYLAYHGLYVNAYFWRTTNQQEIDYIEDSQGVLNAFEFKYSSTKPAKMPKAFIEAYPNATFTKIDKDNFEGFLLV